MNRSHLALAAVLGVPVVLYAVAAPPPLPTSPAAFFPTTVGTRWVYRVERGYTDRSQGAARRVQVMEAVGDRDGERVVTVREVEGDSPYPVTEWTNSDAGLSRRAFPPAARNGPPTAWVPILPARILTGETWVHDDPDEHERSRFTIAGWETVHVPAGTFRALRVDIVMSDDRGFRLLNRITGSAWLAPGVGHVQLVARAEGVGPLLRQELVSFTPGR